MERERNYLIDAIKCLACFGVVMIHMPTQHFGDEFYYMETGAGALWRSHLFYDFWLFCRKACKKRPGKQRAGGF